MSGRLRLRFFAECAAGGAAAALALLTLTSREWIEGLFRVDPDAGSGALEWLVVAVLAVVAVACAGAAQREWRRAIPA